MYISICQGCSPTKIRSSRFDFYQHKTFREIYVPFLKKIKIKMLQKKIDNSLKLNLK